MTNVKTFNRAKALGLLALWAIPVAAVALGFFMQFWWTQSITAKDGNGNTIVSVTRMGLANTRIVVTQTGPSVNNVPVVTDVTVPWYTTAVSAGACDSMCKLMGICASLQLAATVVALVTWAVWLVMMLFNKLKRGMLATVGIWITAMLEAAVVILWVYGTNAWFYRDVSPITSDPTFHITNIYTFYDYGFALACASIGWCLFIMAAYVAGLRKSAKFHAAKNSQVGPSAPEMVDGKGNISKTAAWVV